MPSTERYFAKVRWCEAALIAGFLLLCGFDILHHAMWRDEMQPWLFARDSTSVPDLLRNMHYETHPRLWYVVLFAITRFTANPEAMQVANLFIICAAMAIFVRYCPLPFHLKALTVFGYYFVIEWGTISRNYALGVLFCFWFCAWFHKREKGYLGLAALLFLAIQSNLWSAVLAAGLAWLLLLEALLNPQVRARIATRRIDALASLLLVLGGAFLTLWTAIPQPDAGGENHFDPTITFLVRLAGAFSALWTGFVPALLQHGIIDALQLNVFAIRSLLGLILFAVTVAFFWRSPLILWTYLVGASLLLVLAFVQVWNWQRHTGHFFLWFLVCLWLAHYFREDAERERAFRMSRYQKIFLLLFLLYQATAAIGSSVGTYYFPFSSSKSVATYIVGHGLQALPIAGYPDFAAVPVAGYLNVHIYYLNTNRWGSFIVENNRRPDDWTGAELLQAVNEFAQKEHGDFLVLLNQPLALMKDGRVYEEVQVGKLHKEASFRPSLMKGEDYWLYRYEAAKPAALSLEPMPAS